MKTNLTAMLSFGVVSCPVGVATAGKRRDIEFHNLHKDCLKRINEVRVCRDCDKSQLEDDDLLKGIEIAKGQYVTFTKEEVEALKGGRSPIIEIKKFVDQSEITPIMIENSYILVPKTIGLRSYEILGWALLARNYAGIGTARLWGKETPVAVESVEGVIYLRRLFFADEVASDAEVMAMLSLDINEEESELATMLLDLQHDTLKVEDLLNKTKQQFNEVITAKVANQDLPEVEAEPAPEPSIDYMAALKESVERAKAARAAAA